MTTASSKVLLEHFKKPEGVIGDFVGLHMEQEYGDLNHWAIEMLHVGKEDKILEIGFGTGLAIESLAKQALKGIVVGIDYSETMLHRAKKRNAQAIHEGRVDLRNACISELPDFDIIFDKILAVNSMMYWEQPVDALKHLKSMLNPDGMIVISWMRGEHAIQTDECNDEIQWYLNCLQQAGFNARVEYQVLRKPYKHLDSIRYGRVMHSEPFNVVGISVIGSIASTNIMLNEYDQAMLSYTAKQQRSYAMFSPVRSQLSHLLATLLKRLLPPNE